MWAASWTSSVHDTCDLQILSSRRYLLLPCWSLDLIHSWHVLIRGACLYNYIVDTGLIPRFTWLECLTAYSQGEWLSQSKGLICLLLLVDWKRDTERKPQKYLSLRIKREPINDVLSSMRTRCAKIGFYGSLKCWLCAGVVYNCSFLSLLHLSSRLYIIWCKLLHPCVLS